MKILFYVWTYRVNQKGLAPIMCRVTPKANRKIQFSTKLFIKPETWDVENQKVYGNDSYKLPLYSNQKFNEYLKTIGTDLGIKTKLTHHIGRRTFATTILLSQGIPMEVVKELLGHSSIRVTEQAYASVNKSIILKHINKLL